MSLNDLMAANRTVQANARHYGRSPWQASNFAWLKTLANVARGAAGADIIEELLRNLGYQPQAGAIAQSLVVKGHTVKVKLSMIWAGSNEFVFQQIEDDPYDYLVMLGLEPADAWLWICPKAVARQNATVQHAGDSPWIRFVLGRRGVWMAPFGGNIQNALGTLTGQLGAPP
jgi:hypothetical protein